MGLIYFREALNVDQLIAFCIIWVGIIVTLTEKVRVIRAQKGKYAPAVLPRRKRLENAAQTCYTEEK